MGRRSGRARSVRAAAAVVAVLLVAACSRSRDKDIVVGKTSKTTSTPLPQATLAPPPPPPPAPAPAPPAGAGATPRARGGLVALKAADGHPYPPAIAFRSSVPVPSELTFILVVGSDARPGQDIRRTRADSIHLLAVNPRSMAGTALGFPRDSWVDIPGRGRGKINDALAAGGPGLLAETVRRLTGLPVHYYVLTGFAGLPAIVDELGGVDVHLDRSVNDSFSGARFQAGWQHFNGEQALAFSRNRHDAPNGDFGRSLNQGTLILSALGKMRAEVGDDNGLRRWTGVLLRHADLDSPPDRLVSLAALARRLDPGRVSNVVAPGRVGNAGRQSVVFLGEEASRLFLDLRDDAVIGGAQPAPPSQEPAGGGGGDATTPTSPPPPPPPPPVTIPLH